MLTVEFAYLFFFYVVDLDTPPFYNVLGMRAVKYPIKAWKLKNYNFLLLCTSSDPHAKIEFQHF